MDRSTTRQACQAFLAKQTLAVEASTAADGRPQAAVVAIVANDRFEILFESPVETRKVENLRRDPRVALVVWEGLTTLQYEGVVDEPAGAELEPLLELLFARFPDAKARVGTVAYLRARPRWVRYSPFVDGKPAQIEMTDFG